MPDRVVKTTLIIDDKGAVKVVKGVGEESVRTEGKLKGLDKGVKEVGKSFGGLKSIIGVGLGAVGVGGLAFGLESVANKTKEVATETEKFHTITGLGINSSLAYTQALKARGLSGESVTKAFGFLAKNLKSAELQENKFALSQATATAKGKESTAVLGRQAQALKELGINLQSFNTLSEQQKLEKITKSFEALAPGMQKTRLERELFGRGGNQLSTVLEKNNLGLTHQIDLVKKFFPTIKGGAGAMTELLERQAESKMAWEGLEFTLGQKLIPVMTEVLGWFSKTVLEVEHGTGTFGELGHAVEGVASFFKGLWSAFEGLVGPANALKIAVGGLVGAMVISKVAGFFGALQGGLVAINPELAPFIAGAAAITGLAALIDKTMKTGHPLPASQVPSRRGARGGEGISGIGLRGGVQAGTVPSLAGITGGLNAPLNESQRVAIERSLQREAAGRPSGAVGPTGPVKIDLHVDSKKIAEATVGNPRARREIAEAVAIYSNGMAAHR